MPYGYGSGAGGPPGGGGRDSSTRGADPSPSRDQPTRSPHVPDNSAQIAAEQAAVDELNRQNEMRDLIAQQQQEKDYIDIISKTTAPGTGTTSELQGQLKLDEYQKPSGIMNTVLGVGANLLLPGLGTAYSAYNYLNPENQFKQNLSNFFTGTGQDLSREDLLSGYVSPEDAAAYQAGTYGQPTGGGEGPPPVTGGGGPDVMPITTAQVPPVLPAGGINTLPINNNQTAGYTDQQDFLDNIYRENLLDFFKGTGYTGLYG